MVRRETRKIVQDGNKRVHLITRPRMVNVRMRVRGPDQVIVSGPGHCTFTTLWNFYKRHQKSVDAQLREVEKSNVLPPAFADGQQLRWHGAEYPLSVRQSASETMVFHDNSFFWQTKTASYQAGLAAYRACLGHLLTGYAADTLKEKYSRVTVQVKPYIAKWGLCRPDRKLLVLNLTLAVLPSRLTDYVISHELAHLDVPNHSAAFFRRLEELEPDWRRLGQELQSHRHVHLG